MSRQTKSKPYYKTGDNWNTVEKNDAKNVISASFINVNFM